MATMDWLMEQLAKMLGRPEGGRPTRNRSFADRTFHHPLVARPGESKRDLALQALSEKLG